MAFHLLQALSTGLGTKTVSIALYGMAASRTSYLIGPRLRFGAHGASHRLLRRPYANEPANLSGARRLLGGGGQNAHLAIGAA